MIPRHAVPPRRSPGSSPKDLRSHFRLPLSLPSLRTLRSSLPAAVPSFLLLRPQLRLFLLVTALTLTAQAQQTHPTPGPQHTADPQAAWLTFNPVEERLVFPAGTPQTIVTLGHSELELTAQQELSDGLTAMLHRTPRTVSLTSSTGPSIILGTAEHFPSAQRPADTPGAYALHADANGITIIGAEERGVLYGTYALLRLIAQQHSLASLDVRESPSAPIRWTNEWDNFDGSIERGYSGRSIFFADNKVRPDQTEAARYARLLASIGINGCTINNVNANPQLLTTANLKEVARIAAAFRPYGVRLSLSIPMTAPQIIGGLPTFDPLDPAVVRWWQAKVDEIYTVMPDFGGVVIKADSEGQPGPSQYHRTPADAANLLARALKPHGGVVLYRGFVYNHHLDWRDPKADRARAGYDNFHTQDGQFDSNVVIQIKHGPIDFQVREPVSPLFAGLPHTDVAIELQAAQEYTGQTRHLVFLVPMWKTALDTNLQVPGPQPSTVADIVTGRTFHRPLGGFIAVTNVGLDPYWLGHPLATANLYGFGRLAWNSALSSAQIAEEWTRQTFGNDPQVVSTVDQLQLNSWHTYEDYTGPLGLGTLTDIIGIHFGPGIESAERNGWGQWLRADHTGIGMDRTAAGTGYIQQYPPPLAAQYELLATMPDDLLLFFHHVPYTYRLHSGQTVIQHVYDTHYEGAAAAAAQIPAWTALSGKLPDQTYFEVLRRLEFQAGHAVVWRDAVTTWFQQMSGIPDTQHRVGLYPDRIEAESLQLAGFTTTPVTPAETASGGKAIVCPVATCTATLKFSRPPGFYTIATQYFDLPDASAHFTLSVNGGPVDTWLANDTLPSTQLDGHTSTRHTSLGVALHPGDTLTLTGVPDHQDPAAVDYLELTPQTPQ